MRTRLKKIIPRVIFLFLISTVTRTASSQGMKFSADKYTTNFETGLTLAEGNVVVVIDAQTLKAQKVNLNNKTGRVFAEGSVFFSEGRLTIEAETADLEMKSGMGKFTQAIVRSGNEMYFEARELMREGPKGYRALGAKVTSCQDCPQAWSVVGANVYFEPEAFLEIQHAIPQIFDVPVFYSPILIFPTKTIRQSGLLIPKFQLSPDLGFGFGLPYYWAPTRDFDLTTEYRYSRYGGHGLGLEQRWRHSDKTFLEGKSGFVRNIGVAGVPNFRGGFSVNNRLQLGEQWVQRFEGQFASDTKYSNHYKSDFEKQGHPNLSFEPSVEWRDLRQSARVGIQLNRDNLPRDVPREASIHRFPYLSYVYPSYGVVGDLRSSTSLDLTRFRRNALLYDLETGWIRGGDRFTLSEKLFLPLNLGQHFRYQASSEIKADAYQFPEVPVSVPGSAHRLRVQVDQEVKTEVSRVYSVSNSELKAVRHSIEPTVKWTYSPPDAKSAHPFFATDSSPRFDIFDPNSPDVSFGGTGLLPEEKWLRSHHFATFGVGTRVVGRWGEERRTYEQFFSGLIEKDVSLRVDSLDRPLRLSAEGAYQGFALKTSATVQLSGVNRGRTQLTNEASVRRGRYFLSLGQTRVPEQRVFFGKVTVSGIAGFDWTLAGAWDDQTKKFYGRWLQLVYSGTAKCYELSVVLSEEWNRESGKMEIGFYPTFQILFDESGRSFLP